MFPTTVNQFRALYESLDSTCCAARPWVDGLWRTVLDVSNAFEEVAMVMLPSACIIDVAPGRASCYSDAHKDAYGFRPRNWAPTCAEYDAKMDSLNETVRLCIQEERVWREKTQMEEAYEAAEAAEAARMEAAIFPYASMAAYLDWDLPDRLAAA